MKASGGWKGERGTRHERGYGTAWVKLREKVIERDSGLCVACLRDGLIVIGTDVDHITPKAKGGTDDIANLQLLCGPHHREKTAREASERSKRPKRPDGWRP